MSPDTSPRSMYATRLLLAFVGIVFVAASVMKGMAINDFARVLAHLASWVSSVDASRDAARAVAIGVVAWEACLGLMLVVNRPGRRTTLLALVTMLVFTGVLIGLWIDPAPTGCGCLGIASSALGPREDAMVGVVRNVALLLVIVSAMHLSRREREPATSHTASV